MTQYADLFAALAAPFEPEEVRIRQQAGRQLHYITARTVMNRLDNVLGPESWWDAYEPHENSVLCTLTIRLPDGSLLSKQDAGGFAGMADSGDDDKSGYSDGLKRAAVKFGIGRYLYRDGVPSFVQERTPVPAETAPAHAPASNGNGHANGNHRPSPANGHAPQNGQGNGRTNGNGHGSPPKTGKALFAWTRDQEQRYEVGLLKYLNSWAKLQEYPARMIDWDPEQVSLAYAEACRKLQTVQSHRDDREAYDEAIAN